jgi:acyl-CoA synthetase (AMP-forming)/AMP-acid ligase II
VRKPRLLSEILPGKEHDDAPALLFGDDVITFAQLKRRILATTRLIADWSEAGDRVAIAGPNTPNWIDCYYGVPDSGRLLVFLNDRLAVAELTSVIQRSGSRVLIGPESLLHELKPDSDDTLVMLADENWVRLLGEGHPPSGAVTSASTLTPSDPAWLIYTSGTTGAPKGSVLTFGNILASLNAARLSRPVRSDEVFLFPFPLCHIAGYNVLHLHAHGRPVVVMRRFDASDFIDAVARHGVTSASVTATMLSAVLEVVEHELQHRRQLATLRTLQYGAAPMPASLIRRTYEALGVEFNQGYGMTELSGNAVFLTADDHRRGLDRDERLLRSAGRPAPNVEVSIFSDDGRSVGPGESGEIVVRGAQVMAGYWDDPGATKSAVQDGWLRTGDVGIIDQSGYLTIVDRKKDLVVTGGENVASREVEDAILLAAPEVREVAVIGVPDPHWGENVCAVVTFLGATSGDQKIGIDELNDRLASRLARFKLPRHLISTPELPKNAAGKLDKKAIRAWLIERQELLGERWQAPMNAGQGDEGIERWT